jgi:hypothetical protein
MCEIRNSHAILVGKPVGRRLLGIPSGYVQEDNI